MKIYVARHGQDLDNAQEVLNGRRDQPLTDLGRQQARQAGLSLLQDGIKYIYSSPAKRAVETAKIIGEVIGIKEIKQDEDLWERDFGVLSGKPISEIGKYAKTIIKSETVSYFLDGEGVESFADVYARAQRFLHNISWLTEPALVVSHGNTSRMLRAAFYGWTWRQGLNTPFLGNGDIIILEK